MSESDKIECEHKTWTEAKHFREINLTVINVHYCLECNKIIGVRP